MSDVPGGKYREPNRDQPAPYRTEEALTCMCVEDDKLNQEIIQKLLEDDGHEAVLFDEAFSAWKWLENAPQLPDVILLDCRLPVIDGLQMAERILNHPRLKAIPIVMISAHLNPLIHGNGRLQGVFDFIQKPFEREQLQETLKNVANHLLVQRINAGG